MGFEELRDAWPDAPEDYQTCGRLLEAAYIQCSEFAPAFEGALPETYRLALIMQTRALWQSTVSDTQDGMGEGGFHVTVFPMDWTVKALLRPKRGVPVVG
ncbi:hypothetical protein QMG83_14505 [Salinibacterium sp. G-O1]|uniref:hypothetical protein n=1 Tax=Salinibacterium sp. G-O1 TaxID=3046208 RepID=UPI0024B88044|nr:hypothetical protein [Salinibacterium sp. G-O1]MDJ0336435.1 hypothetical protein [Salinibacterium sp. G-O1]